MALVRETRRFQLDHKVVSPRDVRALANIVASSASKPDASDFRANLAFTVFSSDGSEYAGKTPEVFAEGGILDTKQIAKLEMSFSEYPTDSAIRIQLAHGDERWWDNRIEVSGTDSTWVNGVMRLMEDAVNNWEKQNPWAKNSRVPIAIGTAVGIGRIIQIGIAVVVESMIRIELLSPPPPASWAAGVPQFMDEATPLFVVLELFFAFLLGFAPASFLTDKLVELWPSVELRMGREHAQILKKRKKILGLVATSVLLPILLSLFYDKIFRE